MTARIKIKPAKQGELDGACGFYAITNAIHLLEPDLTTSEIFSVVFRNFLLDGDPQRIIVGTNRGTIKNTLSRTISEINNDYTLSNNDGTPYAFNFTMPFWHSTKERSRDVVINTLRSANHRKGCVAIMGYGYAQDKNSPEYDHWTVIRDIDDDGIITHDSSVEKKRVLFSEIRVDSSQKTNQVRPYNIYSRDVFLINRIYP